MPYLPFSLRYRPQTFAEIVGQEHVSRTLQNAIAAGRVVHAYLFAGPRGTGKTSTARVLAKALLCEKGPTPEPCGECAICRAIAENRALDVMEIDAASNRGIEQIRELREKVRYSPAEARAKVYILDEVHMLTPEAFNALLKTLEEPPEHAYFVLATTELHKVPPTIVSRCQLFEFHLIGQPRIVEALQAIAEREGVEVEPQALEEIARAARGALRDAESIFDQTVAYADGKITVELTREVLGATPRQAVAELVVAMAEGDLAATLGHLDGLVHEGKDLSQLLQDLTLAVRDMLRASLGVGVEELEEPLAEKARALGPERLADALRKLGDAEKRLRDSTQQQVSLELSLTEIVHAWSQPSGRDAARAAAAAAAAGRTAAPSQREAASAERAAAPDRAAPQRLEPEREKRPPQTRRETPRPSATQPTARPEKVEAGDEGAQTGRGHAGPRGREATEPQTPAKPVGSAKELAERWEEVHLQLKRMRRVAVWALLQEAEPLAVEGDVVTFRFDPQWEFHCERIAGPYREDVEEALTAVFGRPMTVRCLLGDTPVGTVSAKASQPQARQAELLSDAAEDSAARASATETTEQKPAPAKGEAAEARQRRTAPARASETPREITRPSRGKSETETAAEETGTGEAEDATPEKAGTEDKPEEKGERAAEETTAETGAEEKGESEKAEEKQAAQDPTEQAVRLTLELFEDSEEIPPE
ncbi:MAG: DNA polymerase III subunit gamma/tau [Armatimonadetes bacterium]|nr:DNA polymerase III subunit gamma/tau [Armatimonadota bacterium]